MERLDKLRKIICEIDDSIQADDISLETNLINDYGFDSIIIVQMIMEIEEQFDVEFEQQDLVLDKLSDISKLLELTEKLSDNQ